MTWTNAVIFPSNQNVSFSFYFFSSVFEEINRLTDEIFLENFDAQSIFTQEKQLDWSIEQEMVWVKLTSV